MSELYPVDGTTWQTGTLDPHQEWVRRSQARFRPPSNPKTLGIHRGTVWPHHGHAYGCGVHQGEHPRQAHPDPAHIHASLWGQPASC